MFYGLYYVLLLWFEFFYGKLKLCIVYRMLENEIYNVIIKVKLSLIISWRNMYYKVEL